MNATKFLNFISLITAVILLLIIFIMFTDKSNDNQNQYSTNKILYIDPEFNEYEKIMIKEAALEWELKTNHIVKYHVIVMDYETKIDYKNGIIINKVSEFNIDVISCDRGHGNYTLGYYSKEKTMPYIGLIYDRITAKELKPVILHELGHSLGLAHNEKDEDMDTLMYPTIDIGASEITEKDLKNFCKIHKC
jgi:predicted Zn-dependent protease